MKTWKIPCVWQMYGYLYIEANTLEEAIENAYDSDQGLPDDGDYVDNSFEVDEDLSVEEIRNLHNNNQKDEVINND